MIPEDIQNIILRYNKEVCNEISAINLAIERIKDSLKVINEVISSDLFSYMKSDKIFVKEKENQLLEDAQILREFISSIKDINESKIVKKSQTITFHKNLSIRDIIVLKTIQKCKHDNHEIQDVIDFKLAIRVKDTYQLKAETSDIYLTVNNGIVSQRVVYTDKENIQKVQQLLTNLGYNSGSTDGVPGKLTNSAILQFEKDHGYAENTDITPELIAQLEQAAQQ